MKAILRLLIVAFFALAPALAPAATVTTTVAVTSSGWVSLGVGPMIVVLPSSYGVYVQLREQDTTPATGATPHFVLGTGNSLAKISEGAQVWALVSSPATSASLDVTTGLEVVGASGGAGGSVSVSNFPTTQAVSWSGQSISVSNFPATQAVSGAVSVSNFPTTQAVSGAVSISNFPTTQAVSVADGSDATLGAKADAAYAGSGSASIVAALKGIYTALLAPTPPGTNNIGAVSQAGSGGADFSANKPALPNIGANFGATGPYANYVLIATVAASTTRNAIEIDNTSGAQIVILRDDGTAASAAAPVNASLFALGGGAVAGAQGGSWNNRTFRGRVQIFAPSSTAQVAVFVD